MLAYIPYMDPMGSKGFFTGTTKNADDHNP